MIKVLIFPFFIHLWLSLNYFFYFEVYFRMYTTD